MLNTSPAVFKKCLIASAIAVLINVIASFTVLPFATAEQIYPSYGPDKLSYFSQMVHLLLLDNQVIIANSILIFMMVFSSVLVALSI